MERDSTARTGVCELDPQGHHYRILGELSIIREQPTASAVGLRELSASYNHTLKIVGYLTAPPLLAEYVPSTYHSEWC
jgi:hypothetical protein